MTHTHFTPSTFYDLCHESTRVEIYECTDWDESYIPIVIQTCLNLRDKKYGLDAGPVFLHCSEMIPESDPEHRLKVSNEDILGLGILYVSPMGLSKASNIRKCGIQGMRFHRVGHRKQKQFKRKEIEP